MHINLAGAFEGGHQSLLRDGGTGSTRPSVASPTAGVKEYSAIANKLIVLRRTATNCSTRGCILTIGAFGRSTLPTHHIWSIINKVLNFWHVPSLEFLTTSGNVDCMSSTGYDGTLKALARTTPYVRTIQVQRLTKFQQCLNIHFPALRQALIEEKQKGFDRYQDEQNERM